MAFDGHGRGPWRPRQPLKRPPAEDGGGEKPTGFRARLRAVTAPTAGTIAGTGRVFALVWGASRSLTSMLAVVTILAGLIPATQAYTAKLLINAVVRAIVIHARHAPDRTVLHVPLLWGTISTPQMTILGVVILLAIVQLVITAFSALLSTLTNISQQLL